MHLSRVHRILQELAHGLLVGVVQPLDGPVVVFDIAAMLGYKQAVFHVDMALKYDYDSKGKVLDVKKFSIGARDVGALYFSYMIGSLDLASNPLPLA